MDAHHLLHDRHPDAADALDGDADRSLLTGIRILVVEDEPDARVILRRMLEDRDAAVEVAESVPTALARLHPTVPDIIVSDIGMPHEDGYDLIRQVRSLPLDQGGAIPAIAVTAFAHPEDRRRTIAAGYQMHISKPVQPDELVAGIRSLVALTHRHD
jgi:CheY-like chemotaxis protein